VAEPPGRIFYRIVRSDPPTLDDFRSYEELGIRTGSDDPETRLRRASR